MHSSYFVVYIYIYIYIYIYRGHVVLLLIGFCFSIEV